VSDRAFAWATATAAGVHLVGLLSASALIEPALVPRSSPVPVEIVTLTPPVPGERLLPARPAPTPAPAPAAARPALPEPILEPVPSAPVAPGPLVRPSAAPASRTLLAGAPAASPLLPGPSAPGGVTDSLLAAPGAPGAPAANALIDDGGLPVATGGLPGGRGQGIAARGPVGPGPAASVIGRVSRHGIGTGVGDVDSGTLAVPVSPARPIAGAQPTPPYPESVRRLGIQGTTVLRFEILPSGRVGRIVVDRSAGHPDLDQAAVDAARDWRFEPARRGNVPVTMWASQPVRFELK
jgi:protein TonB